jgi:hypothetical protein
MVTITPSDPCQLDMTSHSPVTKKMKAEMRSDSRNSNAGSITDSASDSEASLVDLGPVSPATATIAGMAIDFEVKGKTDSLVATESDDMVDRFSETGSKASSDYPLPPSSTVSTSFNSPVVGADVENPPLSPLLQAPSAIGSGDVNIIDIRGFSATNSNTNDQLSDQIIKALSRKTVPFSPSSSRHTSTPSKETILLRSIPTLVLYDDTGLDIFDQITYIPEYYLTDAEIQIFETWGDEMMDVCVKDGGILIELGVG